MTPTAAMLASLDVISVETTRMLDTLEVSRGIIPTSDFGEAKRRVLEIRGKAQELFDWLSEVRFEEDRIAWKAVIHILTCNRQREQHGNDTTILVVHRDAASPSCTEKFLDLVDRALRVDFRGVV